MLSWILRLFRRRISRGLVMTSMALFVPDACYWWNEQFCSTRVLWNSSTHGVTVPGLAHNWLVLFPAGNEDWLIDYIWLISSRPESISGRNLEETKNGWHSWTRSQKHIQWDLDKGLWLDSGPEMIVTTTNSRKSLEFIPDRLLIATRGDWESIHKWKGVELILISYWSLFYCNSFQPKINPHLFIVHLSCSHFLYLSFPLWNKSTEPSLRKRVEVPALV